MLAALAATVFDPYGYVLLDALPVSAFQERRRRINRIATLDGGAVFNDFGYSFADLTLTLRWRVSGRAEEAVINRMAQLYSFVVVSIDGAVFLAAIEQFVPGSEESALILLVSSKLSE